MHNASSPDEVCGVFADGPDRITFRRLEDGMVLIEGNAAALRFLSNLLLVQASFEKDCGFQISPDGAGRALFSKNSDLGIYIHRTPCVHNIA